MGAPLWIWIGGLVLGAGACVTCVVWLVARAIGGIDKSGDGAGTGQGISTAGRGEGDRS